MNPHLLKTRLGLAHQISHFLYMRYHRVNLEIEEVKCFWSDQKVLLGRDIRHYLYLQLLLWMENHSLTEFLKEIQVFLKIQFQCNLLLLVPQQKCLKTFL